MQDDVRVLRGLFPSSTELPINPSSNYCLLLDRVRDDPTSPEDLLALCKLFLLEGAVFFFLPCWPLGAAAGDTSGTPCTLITVSERVACVIVRICLLLCIFIILCVCIHTYICAYTCMYVCE